MFPLRFLINLLMVIAYQGRCEPDFVQLSCTKSVIIDSFCASSPSGTVLIYSYVFNIWRHVIKLTASSTTLLHKKWNFVIKKIPFYITVEKFEGHIMVLWFISRYWRMFCWTMRCKCNLQQRCWDLYVCMSFRVYGKWIRVCRLVRG